MTFKIERRRSGDELVVQLIGNLVSEHLDEVKAQVCQPGCQVVMDASELTLIGVEGIRFLNACQDDGIPIINASPYVSKWMALERSARPKRT
jgi:hypothetical protein